MKSEHFKYGMADFDSDFIYYIYYIYLVYFDKIFIDTCVI